MKSCGNCNNYDDGFTYKNSPDCGTCDSLLLTNWKPISVWKLIKEVTADDILEKIATEGIS